MSNTLLLCAAAVPLLALAVWWLRRPSARPATTSAPIATRSQPSLRATAPVAADASVPGQRPLPAMLAGLEWRTEEHMDPAKRDRLLGAIHDIPRPPNALQQLLSPEFIAQASSSTLSEVVMTEPLIAAKVLAAVNSPLYGLQKPVSDIGQAVTFMGIHRVRAICLQYMLAEAFPTNLPGARKTFDALWQASAIASEIASRLDRALLQPGAAGALATQVVLGFVGPLATASVIPPTGLVAWLQRDRVARARLEQDLLGLNACEIGHLLLKSWALPQPLVEDVRDSGRLIAMPPHRTAPQRLPALALACLSTRLGERLALGQMGSLEGYRLADDEAPDMHHLRACLAHPALARLDEVLQSPDLQGAARQTSAPVSGS
ncbi:HDOD domain-containing protein [Hydrogenophaga sp.]|uniref:HDOD domain-containing protein n=1 Tax=Hydrogenophaga sp. TaxID=1904254 RepID=UPI00260FC46E|nr:HDOD domain-containing protein [Hydrogenophaga sp.]MCW5653830.1 HDOD domain-containing protein [Hydrogenophaga sp.]